MTQKERRRERVIEKHEDLLNRYQQSALHSLMSSGWQLYCVRASLFENPVVVVVNSDGDAFATMEYDGELNLIPDLSLRKDELSVWAAKKTTLPVLLRIYDGGILPRLDFDGIALQANLIAGVNSLP